MASISKIDELNELLQIKRNNLKSLFLLSITIIYLFIGATIFEKLESAKEEESKKYLVASIEEFQARHNMSHQSFEVFYKHLVRRSKLINLQVDNKNTQWTFWGSFFFCFLSVTLIGYGHITPKSKYGKIVFLIYIMPGIGITISTLQILGTDLNSYLRPRLTALKRNRLFCYKKLKNKKVNTVDLIFVQFMLTLLLVSIAAFVLIFFEKWTYFESFYYLFITLTTVGFGDFVPFQEENFNLFYFAIVIIFIFAGLVIMASAINLTVINIRNLDRYGIDAFRRRMLEKKRWQSQLTGDVISGISKQDVVTYMDELPSFGLDDSDSKVCSCDDLRRCFDVTMVRVKNKLKGSGRCERVRSVSVDKKRSKRYFTIRRSPVPSVQHLCRSYVRNQDYILPNGSELRIQTEIKRLAIVGDFIHGKKIERRSSW